MRSHSSQCHKSAPASSSNNKVTFEAHFAGLCGVNRGMLSRRISHRPLLQEYFVTMISIIG